MKRRAEPYRLIRQAVFLLLCLATVYLPLAPVAPGADRVAPDALFCLAMAWVLRDPASAPLWIILLAGLLADALLARPLGLGALALVVATEIARSRREAVMGTNLLIEWLFVFSVFCLTWFGLLLVLRLSFSEAPSLETTLRLLREIALLYPVVSLASMLGFRIFGPRPSVREPFDGGRAW